LHDIIDHMTTRLAICYFPLVSHWNRASIFNRFRGMKASKYIWFYLFNIRPKLHHWKWLHVSSYLQHAVWETITWWQTKSILNISAKWHQHRSL